MVLRGGENVYCAEVEAAIYEHPAVHEAAVFGVPHERLGEEVAAAVLPREGQTLTARSCRSSWPPSWLRSRCRPSSRSVNEPLPRNPAGKILKRELRTELTDA